MVACPVVVRVDGLGCGRFPCRTGLPQSRPPFDVVMQVLQEDGQQVEYVQKVTAIIEPAVPDGVLPASGTEELTNASGYIVFDRLVFYRIRGQIYTITFTVTNPINNLTGYINVCCLLSSPLRCGQGWIRTAVHRRRSPPPPALPSSLPMFEADSQNFASAPRGFKLKNFRPPANRPPPSDPLPRLILPV